MTRLRLLAPLSGWVLPLARVPDPVFAGGLAGAGVALDPVDGELRAPCDGTVVLPGAAKHAVSVRHPSGLEVLMHVGIDTVALRGEGFEVLVADGASVRAGQPLLRFDLDHVARAARSAVTPVLVVAGGRVVGGAADRLVHAGDALFEIELSVDRASRDEMAGANDVAAGASNRATVLTRTYRIPFDHGLHARPAAQVVAALQPTRSEVTFHAHGRQANARSAVSMMALGVQLGDTLDAVATGDDAEAAHAVLATLLVPADEAAPSRHSALRAEGAQSPSGAPSRQGASANIGTQPPGDTDPRQGASASAGARSQPGTAEAGSPAGRPKFLEGIVAVPGTAMGVSVALRPLEIAVAEQGAGEAAERAALVAARAAVAAELQAKAEGNDVLAAHLVLLADPGLDALAAQALRAGKSAGWAWREATRQVAGQLAGLGDERMRERAADLRDLEAQVLRVLAGGAPGEARVLPEHAVLFADEVLPSQLVALDASRIAGIVMARGGPTSHVALLAGARGIPTLVAAGEGVLDVGDGHAVLLDTASRRVSIDPPSSESDGVRERIARRSARDAADLAACTQAAVTRDGTAIAVHANIGAVAEIAPALQRGAEGCGLLRTEFLFLDRRQAPAEDEQYECYAAAARAFDGRPLTLRTLDVGGDKPLAYLPLPREENPALGVRGVRVGLRSPALLRTQLRALLRAAAHGPVRAMLPMVNDLGELRTVRGWLREAARELGIDTLPRLGVMIETPAAALLADQLAREADFLSIGSNDLSQYVLAMDRGHAGLADGLDALHPAVLRAMAQVAQAGRAAGRSVSLCGGLASDLEALPLLVGLGIRELSAVPNAIPAVKRMLRELDVPDCEALAARAMQCETAMQVRELLRATATHPAPVALSNGATR